MSEWPFINVRHPAFRRKVYDEAHGICGICGEFVPWDQYHLDHILPVIVGGKDCPHNVQVTHARCNLRKRREHFQGTPVECDCPPIGFRHIWEMKLGGKTLGAGYALAVEEAKRMGWVDRRLSPSPEPGGHETAEEMRGD